MKKISLILLGVLTLFVIIYFANVDPYTEQHPTLNASAQLPDRFLKNVAEYASQDKLKQSALNLEKAIESIWKLEQDVDRESFQNLEGTIQELEVVHRAILNDSLEGIDMPQTFELALDNLAKIELNIAETYAETNDMETAKIALKYARLHIKNAMLYHDRFWDSDTLQLAIERMVLDQIDSLTKNEAISAVEYVIVLDRMIDEIDQILIIKE